jgi:hypothetical protein
MLSSRKCLRIGYQYIAIVGNSLCRLMQEEFIERIPRLRGSCRQRHCTDFLALRQEQLIARICTQNHRLHLIDSRTTLPGLLPYAQPFILEPEKDRLSAVICEAPGHDLHQCIRFADAESEDGDAAEVAETGLAKIGCGKGAQHGRHAGGVKEEFIREWWEGAEEAKVCVCERVQAQGELGGFGEAHCGDM